MTVGAALEAIFDAVVFVLLWIGFIALAITIGGIVVFNICPTCWAP